MSDIDTTKLSRDYNNEPLQFGETIATADLEYLYIEQNWPLQRLSEFFRCSVPKIKRALHKAGITKSSAAHYSLVSKTFSEKTDEQKRASISKRKETCLKLYGATCSLNNDSVREKAKATCRTNYGVDFAFQSKEVQNKAQRTLITNYGVTSPLKSALVKERIRNNNKRKHDTYSTKQVHIEHKDIWFDDAVFINFIKQGNNGTKWLTKDLCIYFNLTLSTVDKRISSLDLWKYIENSSSKEEKEIAKMITDFGFVVEKYKNGTLEFDIYIPGKNLAIEFNGNYWHSDAVRNDKNYHKNKTNIAKSKGIFLYHIFEWEWYNKTAQVINQLKNLLGVNQTTIYARKCIIREVPNKESQDFQEQNHLRGSASASVRLGLYYNNELVSLMTFGKPRFNKNVEWELVRFCSKAGTNVVGGASKLFKYFTKTYNPKSIVSYSEIAKTTGKLYSLLGFTLHKVSTPNYVWVKHNIVYTRYQSQKHKLLAQGLGELGSTEQAIRKAQGFNRVFDCGNRVHIWRNNNGNTSNK